MMFRYLIAGALASSLLVSTANAQTPAQPDLKKIVICAGSESGNYYWAAKEIAKFLANSTYTVEVLKTNGSLMNLRDIADGKCQMGFSQSDVSSQFIIENPATKDALEIMAVVYTEYAHILCPTASGWKSLSDLSSAKGIRRMIVGEDGSGTAETWRIWRQAEPDKYDSIQRDPSPPDYASAHDVGKGSNTCMLWISGLNSNGMVSTNDFSSKVKSGQPPLLRLLTIDDSQLLDIKGPDGKPLYQTKTITPHGPGDNKPALYDHLINNGGMFSSASIDVLAVPANMMVSQAFKNSIGRDQFTKMLQAIDDAQASIWAKVDPGESD